MGIVAWPPQVTMLMLVASSFSSRLIDGMTYGPIAAGVRSMTCTPCSCNTALCRSWAPAEVASNTIRISENPGMATRPTMPSAVVGTPMRCARARPSDWGSIPTMAAISRPLLWRRTLIMRSVPILPDPIMPTLILPACVISVPLSMCEPLHETQRERTQMLVAHSNIVALADSHRFGDATGKYQGTCGDFLTACAQHIGQHGHALSRMPQHCRPRCRSHHLAVLFHDHH